LSFFFLSFHFDSLIFFFFFQHPGGRDWLLTTQGTDITEAFEVHHLNQPLVSGILQRYYVRDTHKSRSTPFTFHVGDFYHTLRQRVFERLCVLSFSKFVSH
jgi:hypothetical protein